MYLGNKKPPSDAVSTFVSPCLRSNPGTSKKRIASISPTKQRILPSFLNSHSVVHRLIFFVDIPGIPFVLFLLSLSCRQYEFCRDTEKTQQRWIYHQPNARTHAAVCTDECVSADVLSTCFPDTSQTALDGRRHGVFGHSIAPCGL